jgi:hypothetical protein
VTPSRDELVLDGEALAGFAAVHVVEVESIGSLGAARAHGVRAATAPVVFLGETHAFPAATFAEELIRAHEGPWTVVVPSLRNANPTGALSWAGFLLDYGRWMRGRAAGEVDAVPNHNSSFKREALVAQGPGLASALERRADLGAMLRQQGFRACFEPAAELAHLNVCSLRPWLAERFFAGRLLASARGVRWTPSRRLLYALGSPLIPAVVLWRLRPVIRRPHVRAGLPRLTRTALAAGAVVGALGEAFGYAAGAGRSQARMAEYELHKRRYASPATAP